MVHSIFMIFQNLLCHTPTTSSSSSSTIFGKAPIQQPTTNHSSTNDDANNKEDSIQTWNGDDDEFSYNSSSERSNTSMEPQLVDDANMNHRNTGTENDSSSNRCSNIIEAPICPLYRSRAFADTDEDNDTMLIPQIHRPCYESIPQPQRINFCWLPSTCTRSTTTHLNNNNNASDHHTSSNMGYSGIRYNPPIICSDGVSRGNVRLLHRKAWLEVSDTQHRYGKHLRMYYKHWEMLFQNTNEVSDDDHDDHEYYSVKHNFFDWLDSKGTFVGRPLPEIPDCVRDRLDSDTVTYIDDSTISSQYAVHVISTPQGNGRLISVDNNSIIRTGPSGWMFVLRDNIMYVAPKVIISNDTVGTKRFHHSSFFGGRAVQAAGIIITDEISGNVQQVLPHSGHYRPGESDVQRILYFLHTMGISLKSFSVDVQQFLYIDRGSVFHHHRLHSAHQMCDNQYSNSNTNKNTSHSPCTTMKKKKVESLHLRSAITVADFLSHKARCLQPRGIFDEIERRRIE